MKTLAAALTLILLSGAALAQGEPPGSSSWEDSVTMIGPNGQVMHRKITDKAMMDTVMREAQPLDEHSMVVMHGGKMYVVRDRRMPSGRFLSTELQGTMQ